jgi:hypothetical protein
MNITERTNRRGLWVSLLPWRLTLSVPKVAANFAAMALPLFDGETHKENIYKGSEQWRLGFEYQSK